MFDKKERFIMEDYGRKSPFASFLPGISGKYGIPIWCFYVNRGQGVTSFGVEDKNHSIMEFYPAHQSYQTVKSNGFRTFLKIDGKYYEPFSDELRPHKMYIGMNDVEIEEVWEDKIQINVLYYTLPNEELGGLIRKVTIRNLDKEDHQIELLDGMAAVIPYGVSLGSMKEMGQTTKAWMCVEDVDKKMPYFKVRASMNDSVDVQEIKGGHFYVTYNENGEKLPIIVDPYMVFNYDTAMGKAVGFQNEKLSDLLSKKQVTDNNLPCGFSAEEKLLKAGETIELHAISGKVENKDILNNLVKKCEQHGFFERKYNETFELTKELCRGIETKTASKEFDAYCKQTYLDNILRGGFPILLGEDKIFYLYARKHGDIERDYNFYSMLPEFYSQGNANFRDVNQNRRCDVLFSPFVKDENIKIFYNLIQIDGYNPLGVDKATYTVKEEELSKLLDLVPDNNKGGFSEFLQKPFTPGSLLRFVSDYTEREKMEEILDAVIDVADRDISAGFHEGYWTDHWTYNLDLVDSYLSVYPQDEEKLLFKDESYTYFETRAMVNPRIKRYVETEKGVRQYFPINDKIKNDVSHRQLRCDYGKGKVYTGSLMEKLLLLSAVKFAALDPEGMGVEMEGGKPGWYDALNGLPGIFGSSMAETYEVCRMLDYVMQQLKKSDKDILIAEEIKELIVKLDEVTKDTWEGIDTWNKINDVKEAYREKTIFGVSGKKETVKSKDMVPVLQKWLTLTLEGVQKAVKLGEGICPTYFYYEVKEYKKTEEGIIPLEFKTVMMPYFLEGPVRYLKLPIDVEDKKKLYKNVKESNLYDKKLKMYKVNESLNKATYEVGRATAFTPGWLENESIWLHMEYKYLLELLKSEFYEEFFEDFKNAAIPFLDPDVYGRSPLENSSFIASSANPDPNIHGKGFVARLSGSTAEFVHMWQIMMFGKTPFTMGKEGLQLYLEPAIPNYLIGDETEIRCTFLGTTTVVYKINGKKQLIPGEYTISRYEIVYKNGEKIESEGAYIEGKMAETIRNGRVEYLVVYVE